GDLRTAGAVVAKQRPQLARLVGRRACVAGRGDRDPVAAGTFRAASKAQCREDGGCAVARVAAGACARGATSPSRRAGARRDAAEAGRGPAEAGSGAGRRVDATGGGGDPARPTPPTPPPPPSP